MRSLNLKTLVLTLIVSASTAATANAAMIFNFTELGGNVELVVSGSINLAATTFAFTSGNANDIILPSGGNIIVGNCHAGPANPQIIEVTRDKKVVWTFKDFDNFGNALANSQVIGIEGKVVR